MAAATVSPIANLQLLNDLNYEDWSFRLKVYLLAEDVWDVVEATTEPPKPEDGEVAFKAWRKNNAKALLAIQTCCGDDNYPIIEGITEAKAAWDALAEELKPSDSEEETGHDNNDESDVKYDPLYDRVKRGDWNAAKEFIDRHPEALIHTGSSSGGTALHEAIERKQLHIVEELLKLMTEEDLEIEDDVGFTAFFYALQKGMAKIVVSMVKKNEKLVTMRFNNGGGMTPVLLTSALGHWEIARFLYSRTPIQVLTVEDNGRDGAELISSSFVHRNKLGIHVNLDYVSQPAPINFDVRVNFEELEDAKRNQRDLISSANIYRFRNAVKGFFQGVVKNLLKLLGIHDLHEMRLHHVQILKVLRLMCDVVKSRNLDSKQTAFVQKAVFRAVERGQVEFIEEMCKANPRTLMTSDESGRSIFHYAVECRQEKVFNLIYGLSEYDRNGILMRADMSNNSILHAAGSLSAHLNHIQGAALQMQRELQWFKVRFSHFITYM
ncbi:hypothetical protein Pyn_13232 [Prunus yedoensis var. nudiflora]|uniref:Uncharacterized protein n=1 Tax=Prunus yedoensis var. nudiflora TaxID=2094558 RepID=A0A314UNH1_PRUYE|nr:hypothetical protein Pyn_13232 [Prunus yedoensis var. nudiflora]